MDYRIVVYVRKPFKHLESVLLNSKDGRKDGERSVKLMYWLIIEVHKPILIGLP